MAERDRVDAVIPRRIGMREFRGNMASILRQVRQRSRFLVTSRDEVLVEIRPPSAPSQPRRQPGALRSRIHMLPDFDTLPSDLIAVMESGEA